MRADADGIAERDGAADHGVRVDRAVPSGAQRAGQVRARGDVAAGSETQVAVLDRGQRGDIAVLADAVLGARAQRLLEAVLPGAVVSGGLGPVVPGRVVEKIGRGGGLWVRHGVRFPHVSMFVLHVGSGSVCGLRVGVAVDGGGQRAGGLEVMFPHRDVQVESVGAREVFKAVLALVSAAREGLDPVLLELVQIRASQINRCAYGIDYHTSDARMAGETEERVYQLPAWQESSLFTQRERAALALTEAVTLLPQGVSDKVYAPGHRRRLRRGGDRVGPGRPHGDVHR